MKLIITGASGFVGGSLWRAARLHGYATKATGRRVIADPDYFSCELSRGLDVDWEPDVVFHVAARSSPWGRQSDYETQNVVATRRVVEFCERRGRPLLVFLSTSAVMYADEHQWGLNEESALPVQPINEYAATKRKAEAIVRRYSGPCCIVRPRAVFGPGDTVVFPRILRAARAGRLPLIESPQPVVGDLIYIDTLVAYLLCIAKIRATGLYLLTNNQPVPILAFLEEIFAQLGLPAPRRRMSVQRAMRYAGLIERVYAMFPFLGEPPLTRFGVSTFVYSKTFNVIKSLRDLGSPTVPLAEGVEAFVRWQRNLEP
jgi:nucleoside-diphosphate-sugar epimerase